MIIDSSSYWSDERYEVELNYKITGEIEVFYECLLPMKLLKDETFYIKDFDKYVKIDRYSVNNDGSITYFTTEAKILNKDDEAPGWMKYICNRLNREIDKSESSRRHLKKIKRITEEKFKPFKIRRIKQEMSE